MAKDPICGMYVDERRAISTKQELTYYFCSENCLKTFLKPQAEMKKLRIITIFSLALGALTLFFEYIYPVSPFGISNYVLLFFLATPVQFVGGWRFYLGTRNAIKARQANMDSLIAIGTSAAWLYSTVYAFQGILWTAIFPAVSENGPAVYFTESALIIGFILLGRYMEHIVKGRASSAIRKLMDLQPKVAKVIRKGREVEIPAEEIKVGDVMVVRPGEKIPADGIIIEGASAIDQSMVTGESIPIDKKKGDEAIGATINKSGMLKIKATKVVGDTALSQIVRMVQEAIAARAPMQRLADLVSSYFVPVVVIIAIGAFFFWYYIYGLPFSLALMMLISVLIIACPCALGIATPAAIMIGAGKGAQNGILIKSGEYLEKARKINTIVFDKTGTLTKGKPSVTDIIPVDGRGRDILMLAATIEKGSEHPIGQAIVDEARRMRVRIGEPRNFKALSGYGVSASYRGKNLFLGNRELMKKIRISISDREEAIQKLEEEGKTSVFLATSKKLVGIISVADTLKETSADTVSRLKKMGIDVVMITGDNPRTAVAIAKKIGIERVLAEVLPQDKAREIKKLQKSGVVAMVGDGINDAPALARADVGIAIGAGTDVAKETGGIVLMRNDLRCVVSAILLSKLTVKKMKQNLFWAFVYNIALIPVAAGALYPFGILLNPIYAAIAMALSSVTVVGNSMLLSGAKIE